MDEWTYDSVHKNYISTTTNNNDMFGWVGVGGGGYFFVVGFFVVILLFVLLLLFIVLFVFSFCLFFRFFLFFLQRGVLVTLRFRFSL